MPLIGPEVFNCPDELSDALEEIADHLDWDIVVESVEDDWVRFRVVGVTDWCAATQMDLAKHEIFGADYTNYQILCSSQRPHGEGLWIQELDGDGEYCPGVWQY